MGNMGKFCFVVDPVNIDPICSGHFSNIRKTLMQRLIEVKITDEIRGDPCQDPELFQMAGIMMRAQFLAVF